jgi:hypothetical protein
MVLLLLSACWALILLLVAALCAAARNGDFEHDGRSSPAVGQPVNPPSGVMMIKRVEHAQDTLYSAQSELAQTTTSKALRGRSRAAGSRTPFAARRQPSPTGAKCGAHSQEAPWFP